MTSILEWASTIVLVIVLAIGLDFVGKQAEHRIGGRGHNDVATAGWTKATAFPATTMGRNQHDHPVDAHSANAVCTDGFVRGALRTFLDDDDIFTVGQSVVDTAHATLEVAPQMIAAVPEVIAATWTHVDARQAPQLAGAAFRLFVVDPITSAQRLSIDGWRGTGTLIAAARSGDCVTFGRTLRSGVNNAPELAFTLLDVIPMGAGALKLGKRASTLSKAARLERALTRLAKTSAAVSEVTKRAARGAVARTTTTAAHGAADLPKYIYASIPGTLALVATFGTNVIRHGATADAAIREAFQATAEKAARTASKVTHSFHEATNIADAKHTPTRSGDWIRASADDVAPWGLSLAGAVRSAGAIQNLWPKLFAAPTMYRLAVWDLAQARTADAMLDWIELMLRKVPGAHRNRTSERLLSARAWRAQGLSLQERESNQMIEAMQRMLRGEPAELRAMNFGSPPELFWAGRSHWRVPGGSEDLRSLERNAYAMLARAIPNATRTGRTLAVAVARWEATRESMQKAILERELQKYLQAVAPIDYARKRIDNAELSARIAQEVAVNGRVQRAIGAHVRALADAQPITIVHLDDTGRVRPDLSASKLENALRDSLAEQAEAERRLRKLDENFLTDFATRNAHIEVYARWGVPGDDLMKDYLAWFNKENDTLYVFEDALLAEGLHLPRNAYPGAHARYLGSFPTRQDENALFELQRIINEWRAGMTPAMRPF